MARCCAPAAPGAVKRARGAVAFALESHRRAVAAMNAGRFAAEVLPVSVPQRRGDARAVDADEAVRC